MTHDEAIKILGTIKFAMITQKPGPLPITPEELIEAIDHAITLMIVNELKEEIEK
jgi:hypothetical protein